jgi:hypothetical protein
MTEFRYDQTERGFARIDFRDLHDAACSLQASSLATDDAIWFGRNEAKIDPVSGLPIGPRMHLNRAQVAALLPILQHFVMTGEVMSGNPSDFGFPRR